MISYINYFILKFYSFNFYYIIILIYSFLKFLSFNFNYHYEASESITYKIKKGKKYVTFQADRTNDEADSFVTKIIYTIVQSQTEFMYEIINCAFYFIHRAARFHSTFLVRAASGFIALKCSRQYCEKQRRTRGRAY